MFILALKKNVTFSSKIATVEFPFTYQMTGYITLTFYILPVCDKPYHMNNWSQQKWAEIKTCGTMHYLRGRSKMNVSLRFYSMS